MSWRGMHAGAWKRFCATYAFAPTLVLLGGACATAGEGGAGSASGVGSTTGSGGAGGTSPCLGASDCEAFDGPCVEGACINGSCTTLPANEFSACEDGLFCTVSDACQDGICVSGPARACPSSDECNVGTCDEAEGRCIQVPGADGAACNDGDPCTFGICVDGECTGAESADCSFYDGPCSMGVCNPVKGCVAVPVGDGAPCDDGLDDPCTAGACQGLSCVPMPTNNGAACDDGLFCTVDDRCESGACVAGTPRACPSPAACFVGVCDENEDTCVPQPGSDGLACDDANPCTEMTTCAAGICGGGLPANDGAACNDGVACTVGEVCGGGTCGGGLGVAVYLFEDFSDLAPEWLRGPAWEVGTAVVSDPGFNGADPAFDHTPTADNTLAGVVIGGYAPPATPASYLESPPFDASGAPGTVILGFYRWLNSDSPPFMRNMVEVFDGTQWVSVWTNNADGSVQDSPPVGAGWTYVSYDVTAHKNPAMRIRIGFSTIEGILPVSSWSVDDILVSNAPCP